MERFQYFDPLFPGTGLLSSSLDFTNEGIRLHGTGHGTHASMGELVTGVVDLGVNRVWGNVRSTFDLPSSCNLTLEIISTSAPDRITGIPPSYNGSMDLTMLLDPAGHGHFRIRATLRGNGTSTPTLNWLSVSTLMNTPPVVDSASPASGSIGRMEQTTISFMFTDRTDPQASLEPDLEYRTSPEGEWSRDIIGPVDVNGSTATYTISPRAADPVGTYEFRASASDRLGAVSQVTGIYLEVENREVSRPTISLSPGRSFTDNIIRVSVVGDSTDPEGEMVRYRFYWYVNKVLVDPEDPGGPSPGWQPENVSLKESSLSPVFTGKGDNVSCRVVPTDLLDDGPEAEAWVTINNSPPRGPDIQISYVVEEDTPVTIDLHGNFTDVDGDHLEFTLTYPGSLRVAEVSYGIYNVTPAPDINGEYIINVTASDGSSTASGQVSIIYTPINDSPHIDEITSRTMAQGESLKIPVIWWDPEDTEDSTLTVGLPRTWGDDGSCVWDPVNSTIYLQAGNGNVGVHEFRITARDPQGLESVIEFNVTVTNVNDPLEAAIIVSPVNGQRFTEGEVVIFRGDVVDPDADLGQEFVYTWFLVISKIGTGQTINHTFDKPGTYNITLEVSEGSSSKSTSVEIIVQEKKAGGGGGGGDQNEEEKGMGSLSLLFPAVSIVFFLLVGILVLVVMRGRKKNEALEIPEPDESEEEPVEEEIEKTLALSVPDLTVTQPPPPEPEKPESSMIMPEDAGIILPEGEGPLDIPQVDVPASPGDETGEEDETRMEYISPSRK